MRMAHAFTTLALGAVLLAPLGLWAAPAPAQAAASIRQVSALNPLPAYTEHEAAGTTSNDTIQSAELVGPRETISWSQVVTGTIGTSADIDYFQFQVAGPGSRIKLTLDGLPADYDLVLGGGIDPNRSLDRFETGLDDLSDIGGSINAIGGSINAIGGSINAIGGSINAIGGSINAIGGSINAIGGSINAISTNPDTTSERIETALWIPGTYYVIVTTSNGQFSNTPYRLTIELENSGLSQPPPVPEVALNFTTGDLYPYQPSQITTLYIYNSARMEQVYGTSASSSVSLIKSSLASLIRMPEPVWPGAPIENGVAIDLSAFQPVTVTQTIADLYQRWDTNKANPLYANTIAELIDNVIEAATTDGVSGPGTTSAAAGFYFGPDTSRQLVAFPNLHNIVLIGGDAVLPFYRVPDLTTIANEADYAAYMASISAGGIIDPNSAQGAALRYRMLLTDNIYGSAQPYRFYGFPFFLPNLAVGRIVETPEQIARYLSFYATNLPATLQIDASANPQSTVPRRAFISGYDFLSDEAAQVRAILGSTRPQDNYSYLNYLNSNTWQRPELEQNWFDGKLDSDFPTTGSISGTTNIKLSSVNAHFNHWELLPAMTSTNSFLAQRLLMPTYDLAGREPQLYFGGTLGYSVGCHSGYSVADNALSPGLLSLNQALYQTDFPQALNNHGGNWVGNTGYGYGSPDGIDYSERLAVLYTQELAREVQPTGVYGGASIGEALVNAKQRYVRNAVGLSAYDYKVVNVMTLYGLPFARTLVSLPLPPPAEDQGNLGTSPAKLHAPIQPNSDTGRLTRLITFTINLDPNHYKTIARTGSQVLELDESDFTVQDEFQQRDPLRPSQKVRVFNNNQAGVPTLPTFAYDLSALNSSTTAPQRLDVVDVAFLKGSYGAVAGFNPQITQVATETFDLTPLTSRSDEPDFRAGAGRWFPDKFFGFSSVGVGSEQIDQLTAFAAQLRTEVNGQKGLLRPYTTMVFKVTYDDPATTTALAAALDNDSTGPIIRSVQMQATPASQPQQGLWTRVLATVDDPGAPASGNATLDVAAIYVDKNTWLEQPLVKDANGDYMATVPVQPAQARLMLRATDQAGNSSYYTGKGRLTSQTVVMLPLVSR